MIYDLKVFTYGYNDAESKLIRETVEATFDKFDCDYDYPVFINVFKRQAFTMDGAMGWTSECHDDPDMIGLDIEIEITDDLTPFHEEFLTTIRHETVHATQLVRGIPFDEEEAYANEL